MSKFFESDICKQRKHCKLCRSSSAWRFSVSKKYNDIDKEFDCPIGLTTEKLNESLPPIPKQICTLSIAVKNALKYAIKNGKIFADNETVQHRTDTCMKCENLRNIGDNYRCIKCGCHLANKISLKSENCEKW